MLNHASNDHPHRAFAGARACALATALGAGVVCLAFAAPAFAQQPKGTIPELASSSFAWLAQGVHWLNPPAGLRGPISRTRPFPSMAMRRSRAGDA